jgi:RNA polymerase sigma-70 factor (ECF subfamily)
MPMAGENTTDASARQRVDAVYRAESRRVFATLIRILGDFDLAEEAMHEAFASAMEQWPREGHSGEPASVAGVGGAIQGHRRDAPSGRHDRHSGELAERLNAESNDPAVAGGAGRGNRGTIGCA